jgi:HD-GYP domain-containing protein (c-di-GMP phosphodiesterase class II)
VVRWHHENWNGRGYPDGLRGEAIPLSARIVAVADCYDAITTDRPYQKAYEPRFAAEVITKLAGSRFDAKVVTAFLRAFELGDLVQQVREHGHSALEVELPVAANV